MTEDQARERTGLLAEVAHQVIAAGQGTFLSDVLSAVAETRVVGKTLSQVDALCTRGVEHVKPAAVVTFGDVAEQWTSGVLARRYPDHVREKPGSVKQDIYRLNAHVLPLVKNVPVSSFTLDHADAVMRALTPMSAGSRRQVALLLHRVLALSVFPMRLREANPIPPKWAPRPAGEIAKQWLYPDEDAMLLGCTAIPLGYRVLYGFLAREGPRVSEALSLTTADVDLKRGVLTLDVNKTDDPRAWVLDVGVGKALEAWLKIWPGPSLFNVGVELNEGHLAKRFREHLALAGTTRPQLFAERTENRIPIRAHDLRATFVTLSLAHGKSETWVADRTGHRSSQMINKYRRAARTAAELGLPALTLMNEAIPELRERRLRLVSHQNSG
jgi:integrase